MMSPRRYLSELQIERSKLNQAILPYSCRLLNQEIRHVTMLLRNAPVLEPNVPEQAALLALGGIHSNEGANNTRPSPFHSETPGCSSNPSGPVVKRSHTIHIVKHYPNYDFVVSRIASRMDSLKEIEATTGCHVLVRGRGSIQDPEMAAAMMGKPGYGHLNEPLHVVVWAKLPVQIVDSSMKQALDMVKDFLNSLHPKNEPAPISGTGRGAIRGVDNSRIWVMKGHSRGG